MSTIGHGTEIVTSTTRPASPITGQVIYETDTKREMTYSGTTWVQTNSASTTSGVTGVSNLIVPPSLVISRAALQSVNTASWAFTSFDTKTTDTDGMAATIPTDTKVTVQTAGLYVVTAWATFAANSTGNRSALIEKNAASAANGTILAQSFVPGIATNGVDMTISVVASLAASDTLHLSVYQTSGGALNAVMMKMSAVWVGRTS